MATTVETPLDLEAIEAAAGKVMSIYAGSMLNYMIDIGHQTGLLSVAATGPRMSRLLLKFGGGHCVDQAAA
jgi:hypothetical protein